MSGPSGSKRPARSVDQLKRTLDVLLATFAIIVLAAPMLAIAAVIRLTMGRPVLYRAVRPGLCGRPFTIYKFRTMTDRTGPAGAPLPDEDRLTAVGGFLRSTSLDELPQLINVLRGDMSLVGPRPLLMEYLPLYSAQQSRRHEVRPGITGWQQVNGRNAMAWAEKFRSDVWYVDNRSTWLDLKILVLTAVNVLRRTGISAQDHATMPRFTGEHDSQT